MAWSGNRAGHDNAGWGPGNQSAAGPEPGPTALPQTGATELGCATPGATGGQGQMELSNGPQGQAW